jgi:hypothetical protein
MSAVSRDNPVVGAIKALAPVSMKIIMRDGTEKAATIPKSGKVWQRLEAMLDAFPWERIECYDKDGKLLAAPIEREGDEEDGEEVYEEVDASTIRGILRDAMKVNLEVMRTTMRETRQIFETQTKSQSDLVTAFSESMRVVQDSYSLALKVQTTQMMGAQAAPDDEVMKMMQMGMLMMNANKAQPPPRPPAPAVKVPPQAKPANPGGQQ